jgi:23S rRNA-/tRNA-specific pseudouridylate synthase
MLNLFSTGTIKKTYHAVVVGVVERDFGRIDVPLAKQSELKKHWWMKADPNGAISACTDFRVLKRLQHHTLLELTPHTGRTHQLRVHCSAIGHHIVGDYIYGTNPEEAKKQTLFLHANNIEIPLYPKKAPLQITAPWPEHMKNLIGEFN